MPSLTIDEFVKNPDGSVFIRSGKYGRLYPSVQALRDSVRASLTRDDLFDLTLALAVFRQPALGNPGAFVGRTVNMDFSAANFGTVT